MVCRSNVFRSAGQVLRFHNPIFVFYFTFWFFHVVTLIDCRSSVAPFWLILLLSSAYCLPLSLCLALFVKLLSISSLLFWLLLSRQQSWLVLTWVLESWASCFSLHIIDNNYSISISYCSYRSSGLYRGSALRLKLWELGSLDTGQLFLWMQFILVSSLGFLRCIYLFQLMLNVSSRSFAVLITTITITTFSVSETDTNARLEEEIVLIVFRNCLGF